MLSIFRAPNSKAVSLRRDHIAQRDRDLCFPVTEDIQVLKSDDDGDHVPSLADLPAVEIDVQEGDVDILSSDLQQLAHGIKTGRWTSTRLVQAFTRSARRSHLQTNCITVPNFQAALTKARELDAHFATTSGEVVGPFHGIPFSFKENNNIQGLSTSVGYTSWIIEGPATSTAALALMTEHLGGIVLCKTNIPQTMMSFECSNPVYGRTSNPYSPNHTCGGSSGGEAAILASDGVAAGFGSDIGGSLRMPAGYCGIYAIKPSAARFPGRGTRVARKGFEGIPVGFAPMCRSAADLELVSTELIRLLHPNVDSPLDPFEVQRRFQTEELRPSPLRPAWFKPLDVVASPDSPRKKIRLGYYYCDGITKTSPACIRAVQESVDALRAQYGTDGPVELVEIDPAQLGTLTAIHIFLANITADNFDGLLGPLTKDGVREPMDPSLFLPVFAARAPQWFKSILRFVATYIINDPSFAYILTAGGSKTAGEYFHHVARRRDFEQEFITKVWEHYDLDGIICPVQASPAVPHGACAKLSTLAASTILYNVLDYSIAVCPVTRVDSQRDTVSDDNISSDGEDNAAAPATWNPPPKGFDTCSPLITRSLYTEKVYDAKAMHGLPVGVQVVAKKHEEEKSIGLMRLLDDALKARGAEHEKLKFGPGQFTKSRFAETSV